MYLARVLVGQYCVGKSSMIVPPPKNYLIPQILYESVVDNLDNPSIFVVFFDNQCYPEYLITINETKYCQATKFMRKDPVRKKERIKPLTAGAF